ncbi:transporter associated domain-containing protein [Nonomuraea terrae]|uniref:transporter associated domain-containing protein n=1 Tax=Nonomuraea terrae TaxID=2530383 RepID=UPI001FE71E2E|nr:transporter associated domain-containing protein [Nonomuraea terrae]
MHDLPDLDVHLEEQPESDYTTIAGLILTMLGHVPDTHGETVTAGAWQLRVQAVEGHAITQVRLTPIRDDAAAGPGGVEHEAEASRTA